MNKSINYQRTEPIELRIETYEVWKWMVLEVLAEYHD